MWNMKKYFAQFSRFQLLLGSPPPPINQVNSSSACGQYYKASTIVIYKSIVENISNFILVRKTLELQFTLLEAI